MTAMRNVGIAVLIFLLGNIACGLIFGLPGDLATGMDAASLAQRMQELGFAENLRLTLEYAFLGIALCLLDLTVISFGLIPLLLVIGVVVLLRKGTRPVPTVAALVALLVLCEIAGLVLFSAIEL